MIKYLAAFACLGATQAHAHSDGVLHTLTHGLGAEQILGLVMLAGLAVALRPRGQVLTRQRRRDDR